MRTIIIAALIAGASAFGTCALSRRRRAGVGKNRQDNYVIGADDWASGCATCGGLAQPHGIGRRGRTCPRKINGLCCLVYSFEQTEDCSPRREIICRFRSVPPLSNQNSPPMSDVTFFFVVVLPPPIFAQRQRISHPYIFQAPCPHPSSNRRPGPPRVRLSTNSSPRRNVPTRSIDGARYVP
jgi:hypothetical protein